MVRHAYGQFHLAVETGQPQNFKEREGKVSTLVRLLDGNWCATADFRQKPASFTPFHRAK